MSDEIGKSLPLEVGDSAKREEEILAFWNEKKISQKTLEKQSPKGDFVFYDGPPFATGLPHYGHILAGTIKDAIPRYKTMQGYRVRRRWGWDCHGLPLENQIEKELNLETKRDIETLGVSKFNESARKAVLRYADNWKKIVPRFGRFVDMDDDYRTMDATYTESVWWAFKRLHDKGLIYEGYKAMHLCPRCGTTLSNFEVAQGYKDITDLSVTVKLSVVGKEKTYLLAWTTTPWTLPGNMAAAVNPDLSYVQVAVGDEHFILGKERVALVIKTEYTIEKEMLGKEIIGWSYTPPFPYFESYKMENKDRAWKVYGAPYVTMDDGTGLVHLAPAFGAEDLELAQKEKIPIVHHVNKDGMFVDAVTDFKGIQAKPKEDPSNPSGQAPQSTDVLIIKYLAAKGLLFSKEKIVHSYPHCWRCDTPLLNYAASSWFVAVTKFSKKLVDENKKITWLPAEVGQNRFGDWLENARDWAISRSRYWGAPIPVWRNPKTKENIVMGSIADLKKYVKRSGNQYFVMRHGEAGNNVMQIWDKDADISSRLTKKGEMQAQLAGAGLKEGIDVIFSSPYIRAKQTAEILCSQKNISTEKIQYDARLHEWEESREFERKPLEVLEAYYERDYANDPTKRFSDGESFADVVRRVGDFIYETDKKHVGKNILIVAHAGTMRALEFIANGMTYNDLIRKGPLSVPQNAVMTRIDFVPVPHNAGYELDFHRPYIDEVHLEAKDGTHLERVHDVFDCWFESGSMPFAQDHYPFDNLDTFNPKPGWFRKPKGYPADFISESLDQTRGWFYSLLVLGVGLFDVAPYKTVIVGGIVLAEDGQKMSKRLKNYPDPLDVASKYGADAIRYYLLSSQLLHAEDLNFSEKGVGEVASKLIGRMTNVVSFYDLYKNEVGDDAVVGTHVLDRWIVSRLGETVRAVEEGMEAYMLDKATRPLLDFVDDLSTWYLRRSRDRFKVGGEEARQALGTTRYVLKTFAKVSAPYIPFVAEAVFQNVKNDADAESVHLCEWPSADAIDLKLIADMNEVRQVISIGLEKRQKAGIKVRQPLQKVTTKSKVTVDYADLVRDELNVKEVVFKPTLTELIELDTELTDELREEGELRGLIREVQELRKQAGLSPKDEATLMVGEKGALIEKHWENLRSVTNLKGKTEGAFGVKK